MKKFLLAVMAFATLSTFTACDDAKDNDDKKDATEVADDANDKKLDDTKLEDDAEWAVKTADGGMEEVMMGKLAQTQGTNPKVKELGKMMEADHSKANEEFKAMAASKGITLPTALSKDHQDEYDDLAKKTGADFDKAYTALMVDDHEDDIDHFKHMANDGKDADMKTWAAGKVPVLEHHLEMAKAARDAVK
jgi:putative membrane protein